MNINLTRSILEISHGYIAIGNFPWKISIINFQRNLFDGYFGQKFSMDSKNPYVKISYDHFSNRFWFVKNLSKVLNYQWILVVGNSFFCSDSLFFFMHKLKFAGTYPRTVHQKAIRSTTCLFIKY